MDPNYLRETLNIRVSWFSGRQSFPYMTPTFLDRVRAEKLPSVSWIDPDFVDFKYDIRAGASNDDHPPADIRRGQELVLSVFASLAASPLWRKTLLIVVYDEHGGFFDHVKPPPKDPPDDEPDIPKHFGVRVPAIIVSPFVSSGMASHVLFDHTSIIKTILVRFCRDEAGTIPNMGSRVTAANHLGSLLMETGREAVPVPPETAQAVSGWHADALKKLAMAETLAADGSRELTDFQEDYLAFEQQYVQEVFPRLAAKTRADALKRGG